MTLAKGTTLSGEENLNPTSQALLTKKISLKNQLTVYFDRWNSFLSCHASSSPPRDG